MSEDWEKCYSLQIGYQFVMRWVNNHVYFMKQKCPLGKRILEQVRELPFENSPQFVDEVIERTCKPNGYCAVTDGERFRDFYNFCIFYLIKASEENQGNDIENILFDQPLVGIVSHHLERMLIDVLAHLFVPDMAACLSSCSCRIT